jgi:hypothetical protein
MARTIKRDYKIGDRVRVVSSSKNCCSECDRIAAYFEKHKPTGTITYVGISFVGISFDEPQDIYAGDDDLVSNWTAKYKHIQPAGPIPGEQLTFVFTGPDNREDKKEVVPIDTFTPSTDSWQVIW